MYAPGFLDFTDLPVHDMYMYMYMYMYMCRGIYASGNTARL